MFISLLMNHPNDEIIILGDFDFQCVASNAAFVKCAQIFKSHSV